MSPTVRSTIFGLKIGCTVGTTRVHWSLRIVPPFLRDGQILEVDVLPTIDGTEFAKRPGPGQMVFFLQVRDREGATYQSHRVVTLNEKRAPPRLPRLNWRSGFV